MNTELRTGRVRWLCLLTILLVPLALPHPVLAVGAANIHWAYSTYFGTGTYKIGDAASVAVVRPTPGWTLREAAIDADGGRTFGWRVRVPVAIGYHNFDFSSIPEIIDPGNVVTFSVTPGVEMDIPVTRRWLLRPLAFVGWGTATGSSESAWSYWAGVKSRYSWNTGQLEWSLLNAISYVGFNPSADRAEGMVPIMMGFEWGYPFTNFKLSNKPLVLSWHLVYTSFHNDLDIPPFLRPDSERVVDLWQVGLAFGMQGRKFEFWKFKWDRFGLAFERGGNNNLRGVKIYFSSVFDK